MEWGFSGTCSDPGTGDPGARDQRMGGRCNLRRFRVAASYRAARHGDRCGRPRCRWAGGGAQPTFSTQARHHFSHCSVTTHVVTLHAHSLDEIAMPGSCWLSCVLNLVFGIAGPPKRRRVPKPSPRSSATRAPPEARRSLRHHTGTGRRLCRQRLIGPIPDDRPGTAGGRRASGPPARDPQRSTGRLSLLLRRCPAVGADTAIGPVAIASTRAEHLPGAFFTGVPPKVG